MCEEYEMSATDRMMRDWLLAHPMAYLYVVSQAFRLARDGYVYAGYLVQMVRNELHVSISRDMAWPLGKVLETNYPQLRGKICY